MPNITAKPLPTPSSSSLKIKISRQFSILIEVSGLVLVLEVAG
ncbi:MULTISPECIES: hypothetical protein [unclassified Moorena]|nr:MULTISPECIES: hypothetical protein [unclassified Moorena]